jgi:D-3-phosphoglycerate dehydrogenase
MKKVLVTDHPWPELDVERTVLADVPAELVEAPAADPRTLAALAPEVDAIITCWANVPREVIEAAGRCRIIARTGIGLDNIDTVAATARKIVVTNVPDYCMDEVAEHTLALLLALGRKVAFYHQQTKSGGYDLNRGPELRRLRGQTLGIVGLGKIGRNVAAKAAALGLGVLATDPDPSATVPGVERCHLDELLTRSDYVSLHLPLTEATRGLIGAPAMGRMKPGSYLINTARGGLVDAAALAEALESGRLAGAALDVQEPEPPPLDRPPYNDPRVIVTPHASFLSAESLLELRTRASRQVADFLTGRRPENVVNPEVLPPGKV